MITQPLIIYNTSIPQSLADAQTYIALRGLPTNLMGINFGAMQSAVVLAALFDGTFTVQDFQWDGVPIATYNGAQPPPSLIDIFSTLAPDALLMSTYTPIRIEDQNFMMSAYLGYLPTHTSLTTFRPNGRIGCVALSNFEFANELVCRDGQSVFPRCVQDALLAEQVYNFNQPHWATTASTGDGYGFTAEYNTQSMQTLRQRCQWTIDLAVNAPTFKTVAGTNRWPLFALATPMDFNDEPATAPGAHTFSSNYSARRGAWSLFWYSYQWAFAMDLLWNGGAASFTTATEPFANGIRNPRTVLDALMSGISLAEALNPVYSVDSSPTTPFEQLSQNQSVIGDPLYRPYFHRDPPSVAAPPYL